MFEPDIIQAIQSHAASAYPEPCRGVVRDRGDFVQYRPDGDEGVDETLLAIIRSHPEPLPAWPSDAEQQAQMASGVAWGIVPVTASGAAEPIFFGGLTPTPPFLGRSFVPAVTDCLSLILDWYRIEVGVDLGSYVRANQWWVHGEDLYLKHLPEAGFVQVGGPGPEIDYAALQRHDLQLITLGSVVPNHCAIYLGGEGRILHHLHGRVSHDDDLAFAWRRQTHSWWRHQSQV